MTRYSIPPFEDNFRQWDNDRKARRNQYWDAVRQAGTEYKDLNGEISGNKESFYYYMQKTYGVKIDMADGGIGDHYEVVDPKKFMLWQLKHWR